MHRHPRRRHNHFFSFFCFRISRRFRRYLRRSRQDTQSNQQQYFPTHLQTPLSSRSFLPNKASEPEPNEKDPACFRSESQLGDAHGSLPSPRRRDLS